MSGKVIQEDKQVLKLYFSKYLHSMKKLSSSSVKHYLDALNNVSRKLKLMGLITSSIYEIDDIEELETVRNILYKDSEFNEQNARGKRMYSSGLNHYITFASGEFFESSSEMYKFLDIPIPIKKQKESSIALWTRSRIVKEQVLLYADYKCEINQEHKSFITEKNRRPYMEGHHVIPMKCQNKFDVSLDIYANIICLCPLCHREIHFGLSNRKLDMMAQIYSARSERYANSGIRLSKDEFQNVLVYV